MINKSTIERLQERISELHSIVPGDDLLLSATPIKEKLLIVYTLKVARDLSFLFKESSEEHLNTALEAYLETNWNLVKGSYLCYTASIVNLHPNAPTDLHLNGTTLDAQNNVKND